MKPEVNVWRLLQVLVVVVPNASEMVLALFTSGYANVSAVCLLLNVFQSVEERYPLVEVFAWEIEIAFEEIERGADALVIRLRYAVFQSVVLAVRGIEKPAVKERMPVPLVYVS